MLSDLLRDTPHLVLHKQDRYGPLGLLLFGTHTTQWRTGTEIALTTDMVLTQIVPVPSPPFPDDKLAACAAFAREWQARTFTKRELLDELNNILTLPE